MRVALVLFASVALAPAYGSQPTLCTLTPRSDPIVIEEDGPVLEVLDLAVPEGTDVAISVTADNVVIRNVRGEIDVHHAHLSTAQPLLVCVSPRIGSCGAPRSGIRHRVSHGREHHGRERRGVRGGQ